MKTKIAWLKSNLRGDWAPLAGILLLALVTRVAMFAITWHNFPDLAVLHTVDTASYLEPAKSLLSRGDFSQQGMPELVRTPGYPLLLSAGIALGHVEVVTFALQTLLSLITVGVIYRLARSLTSSGQVATIAGLLLAIEPLSVTYSSWMASETLFTCLLVLMIAALASYGRSNSIAQLTVAAAVLAAATLVRPISYFLPPVIALALFGRGLWRFDSRLRSAAAALLFLIVSFGPTAGWQVRNWAVAGYGGFSAITDWNLYFFQGASVLAYQKHQSLDATYAEMGNRWGKLGDEFYALHPELRLAGQAETFRFMRREGSRLVRQHPLTYAQIHLRGLAMLLLNPGAADLLALMNLIPENQAESHPIDTGILAIFRRMHRESPTLLYTNLLLAAGLGILYSAAALGLVSSLGRWSWGLTVLVLMVGYLVTISGGPTGIPRLRHPVMPLACLLSGIGITAALRWRTDRPRNNGRRAVDRRAKRPETEELLVGSDSFGPRPRFATSPYQST
jgi:hypothetical protein